MTAHSALRGPVPSDRLPVDPRLTRKSDDPSAPTQMSRGICSGAIRPDLPCGLNRSDPEVKRPIWQRRGLASAGFFGGVLLPSSGRWRVDCRMPISSVRTGPSRPIAGYLRKRLDSVGIRPLDVLDVGCGDGALIEALAPSGHRLHGFELVSRESKLRARLTPHLGSAFDARIRFGAAGDPMPFEDASFDVLYSNQVFEHVRCLERLLQECARVLRPRGQLIALFPPSTHLVEAHSRIPGCHWVPTGRWRRAYLRGLHHVGFQPVDGQARAHAYAAYWDRWLEEHTFYRSLPAVRRLAAHCFETVKLDGTAYLDAALGSSWVGARRLGVLGAAMRHLGGLALSYGHNAALLMQNPRRFPR